VKNILAGLGVLFLVAVALFTWVGASSRQFRQEQSAFVETFLRDFSTHWDVADVRDRLSDTLAEQTSTTQGQQLLREFKQLGALKSVRDLELQRYFAGTNGRTGYFSLNGTFENGEAVVHVSITKKDGAVHVIGFYLKGTHARTGGAKIAT
jgi:hypothetical protein